MFHCHKVGWSHAIQRWFAWSGTPFMDGCSVQTAPLGAPSEHLGFRDVRHAERCGWQKWVATPTKWGACKIYCQWGFCLHNLQFLIVTVTAPLKELTWNHHPPCSEKWVKRRRHEAGLCFLYRRSTQGDCKWKSDSTLKTAKTWECVLFS
jgi:hypothetical protein